MAKKLLIGDEAREQVYKGINAVASVVAPTMWPKGRNVLFNNQVLVSTNDGVTVANAVKLSQSAESLWAELVKQAANKSNTESGDGTTTTTVLTRAIAKEGMEHVGAGINPFSISKGLDKATKQVIEQIKSKAVDVSDNIKDIATVSAQDDEIGSLIADIMEEIGKDGIITVSETSEYGIHKEIVPGLQFQKWYASHYFINDYDKQQAVLEKPVIIVTDQHISTNTPIEWLLGALVNAGNKNILVIADDFDEPVLANFVLNNKKGMNIVAVKAPQHGQHRAKMLEDIAIITGAALVSPKTWLSFNSVTLEDVGYAESVTCTKFFTTIVGGKGKKENIEARVKTIRENIESAETEWWKKLTKDRLASMLGWVALIKVGAPTDVDTQNKIFKIEDAIHATRSAIEEGIVAGGGTMLAMAEITELEDKEENIGASILSKALSYPLEQIAHNAGYNGQDIVNKVRETGEWFNAKTGEYWDLIEMWVIDPVKVIRVALENAVSAASTFLATECIIIDEEKDD